MSDIQTRLVTTSDINDPKYVITPGETLTGNFADIMGGKDLDGVIQLSNDCTGTLLSSGKHILTAGHCLINEKPGGVNVIFRTETGTKVIASKHLFIHPNYNDATAGNDIAIIELVEEAPLSASRYDIYRDQDEIGKTFLKVGYGLPGKTKEQPSLDDGKKRAGLNTFEGFNDQFDEKFDTPAVPNGTQLVFDYDNGLVANDAFGTFFNKPNLGFGLDEVNTSRGDSGGPAFINGKIAGITSDGIGQDAGVTTDVDNVDIPNSSFGEFAFDNRVSIYANWIDSIVNNTQPVSDGKKSDFNGDDKIDIVWQNDAGTQNQLWLMNNSAIAQKVTLPNRASINWEISSTGDFDNDGKTDILLRNYANGNNQVWLMNGTKLRSKVNLPARPNLAWQIEGTGDFDADGNTDILWRNNATGSNQVWLMSDQDINVVARTVNLPARTNLDWEIEGVGDFNADNKPDIVWRNDATGGNQLWLMNGTTLASRVNLPARTNLDLSISGVGDFNYDGKTDILWRNYATGGNQYWAMNNTRLQQTINLPGFTNTNWESLV